MTRTPPVRFATEIDGVITAATFEMIETVSREALERHPVWTPYDPATDRHRVIDAGVDAEALDREFGRYEFCGLQPLYPVLQLDPLPALPHMIVAARFEDPRGESLSGYVLDPHSFGIFVAGRDFCFNRTLPALAARIASALASTLDSEPDRIFPMRYRSELRRHDGREIAGDLAAFW